MKPNGPRWGGRPRPGHKEARLPCSPHLTPGAAEQSPVQSPMPPTSHPHCKSTRPLSSLDSGETPSTGTGPHAATSIGCSSALSASGEDGGWDRVSPRPPPGGPSQGLGRKSRDLAQDSGTPGLSQLWPKPGQRGTAPTDPSSVQVPGERGGTKAGRHRHRGPFLPKPPHPSPHPSGSSAAGSPLGRCRLAPT